MTLDANENGPDTASDNRSAQPDDGSQGSGSSSETWLAGLSEDNRSLVEAKKWDDPNKVLESYKHLEEHSSKALVPPKDEATSEEWDAFYKRLGKPEKPDGYEFKLPEGLPEDLPYDDTMAAKFKAWAHNAGVTPRQAQALHDAYVGDAAETYASATEATRQKVTSAHDTLVKEWGAPETEKYKRNVELADRAIRQLGGDDLRNEMLQFGLLTDAGEVASAPIAKMLAKVGEGMFAEDTAFSAPNATKNPFSEKNFNLTEQGQLIRSDPSRAKAFIQEAGLDPVHYGLGKPK